MSADPRIADEPRRVPTALHLACTEVWGGNRPIDAPIELPGLRGHLYSRPCDGGRGGDVHYLSVCGSGLIARVCLADVVGHGEAVATVSTALHDLLLRHMNWLDQRRVLRKLNQRLARAGLDSLTTAVVATYYPPAQRLSVSYAGHPPAWVYSRADGRWTPLTAPHGPPGGRRPVDLPLAVDRHTCFGRMAQRVALGDRLLVFTDGVLETPGVGGEQFGTGRLERLLRQRRAEPTDAIVAGLVAELRTHAGRAALAHDDVTLLLLEVVPGPRGPAAWHALRNRLVRPRGNSDDGIFADPRAPAGVRVSG